jgi:hypothetical protein
VSVWSGRCLKAERCRLCRLEGRWRRCCRVARCRGMRCCRRTRRRMPCERLRRGIRAGAGPQARRRGRRAAREGRGVRGLQEPVESG